MPVWLGLAVAAAILLAVKSLGPQEKAPALPGAPSPPTPPSPPGAPPAAPKKRIPKMNDDLLAAALALVPPGVTLTPVAGTPDPVLDPVYGGRKPDAFGAPAWNYYQMILGKNPDGSVRKGGTSCVITLTYLMGLSGWPKEMINRAPTDPWATGSGFMPGSMKLLSVAKHLGFYKSPEEVFSGDGWTPGLAYHIDHPERQFSDHVGTVIGVADPAADGTRVIDTLDGGQGPGGTIQRNKRILSADGKTLSLNGVSARVLGLIRGGDAANA